MSEHHHHHHHKRDESPRREGCEEYSYVESYERPPPSQQGYGAYPPGPYGAAPAPYGAPPGPYGNAPYGVQQEGYGAPQGPYGSYGQPSGNYGPPAVANVQTTEYYQEQRVDAQGVEHSKNEVRRHKREEEVAGVGALAAGAFAMYEGHRAKTDLEHSDRHKLEEEVAAGVGVGAGGYAMYEHHKKKESSKEMEAWEKQQEELSGQKKHHGWFG